MSGPSAMRNIRMVRRRLVVQIYGYQLTAPADHYRHFGQDIALFDRMWSLSTAIGPPTVENEAARWPVRVRGQGWETETDYRVLRFDDLMAGYHRKSLFLRMLNGYVGLINFVFNRAMMEYVRYNKRYAILTSFPLVFTAAAVFAGWIVGGALLDTGGVLVAAIGAALTVAACLFLTNRYTFLMIVLENWAFASALVRGLEPDFAQRLAGAASQVAQEIDGRDYDEILVVGHSLGAVLALYLADRLLEARPIAAPGPGHDTLSSGKSASTSSESTPIEPGAADRAKIMLLTVGSSLLKIGLHSAAHDIRHVVARVTSAADIKWVDYQSRIDAMNFAGPDPARALSVQAVHAPVVRAAKFSQMLEPAAFRRLYLDFYRCHNQFVRAGTRRAAYDYFMFTCGPFFLTDLIGIEGGACEKLSLDGALL